MKCGGAGSITCCLTLLPTWWLLLNDAVISASSISEEANSLESCDRSRVILKQPWGVFGDGPGKYRPNTYCQWLIIANSSSRFIHLSFRELKTECSYDHVFVHDGDSVDSPLLAGLSGDTVPRQPIVASSGKMLVLLFSDTNYFLEGFNAEYSVSDCMFNCSGHGLCADHECVCDELYSGDACENPLCPDDCGEALGRGVCDLDKKKCRCSVHFAGTACDLPAINDDNARWIMLARGYQGSDAFMPSTAMSGVYSTLRDTFYVFGGYDLNSVNDQLFAYDFSFGLWVEIIPAEPSSALPSRRKYNDLIKFSVDNNTVSVRLRDTRQVREYKRYFPRGRFGHAMAYLEPDLVVLYGGEFSDGSHSDELWTYNVTSNIWILVNTTGVKPPPLSKHTLTIVGDNTLYLFGGSKSYGEFSSDMYRLNMSWNPLKWERVRFRGGKAEELRLVGHTAVYYAASNSLIVYGGIAVNLAKFSVLSDKMFVFDVETSFWSELSYPRGDHYDHFVPMKRAFHSAQIIGNFMVIFGGYSHHHNQEEKCYDDRLYLYHLGCHTWISPSVLKTSQDSLAPGVLPSWVPVGRYSHASAVRLNHTLLIAGGFHGNVDGNFIALIFPTSFVSNGSKSIAKCSMYKDRAVCSSNPECGWCEPEMVCLDRTAGANCTGNLQSSHCPGICPSITDCVSCMIHRRDTFDDHSVAGKKKLLQCHWCVQNAYCHARHDVGSLCGTEDETVSGTTGWWGPKGDEVSSVEECVRKDRRPGLTLLVYKHPKDLDHPDEVSIINSTMETFTPQSYLRETGPPTARMFGYLHPLGNKPSSGEPDLQVSMSVANAVGVLKIGSNDSNASLEVVGNQTTGPTREVVHRVTARRPGGGPMFSNSSRGSRYLLDFEVMQKPSGSSTFKMRLDWNQISGSGFGIPRFNKEITYEFLEPYSNGSCKSFRNCLACLSDAECAWCDATATCLRRNDAGTAQCGETPLHLGEFLRLDPSLCPLCSDHISCFACVSAGAITGRPWCEWLVEEATCVRRGKTPESLIASGNLALAVARDSTECPVPCHARLTCTDCLDLPGKCSWCAARKECFVFSVFTSRFQYAQCRDWTDEDAALQPHEDAVGGPMFGGTRSESEDSKCRRCETAWNCSTCLKRLGCGWCYNQDNPTIGVCVGGDFTGPRQGTCEDSIRQARRNSTMELAPSSRGDQPSAMALIAIEAKSAKEDLNVTLSTGWAYDVCSDVDECRLGLHDCHPDAECLNTRGHFRCACKRGFAGDGRSVCERTCFDECVHGHCSGAPEFKCQCPLGWTGTDCSQDCKCRGHSTCKLGIGICDECKFLTRGEFCDECVPGSFGNASSLQGCRRCFCNGHGDEDKGVCDPVSGTCFCRDNTAGRDCHRCKEGFYGDPRNGGLCYRKCKPRDFIHGTDSGGLGAFFGSSDEEHCLWIVSIFDSLEEATLHPPV
ncbi:unnamed protein product [Notodromas monacha]|uniref:Multiple epidermal growth factor-like domains protein 8 n=1 Tax=Notodromas monacha TaxID=399045 RepID=A0A7R9GAP2_9CRUS|nr:unnamed protein product [Notodromas monacha]CAG0913973.1 unnamed protein product [Notodromas monacha]